MAGSQDGWMAGWQDEWMNGWMGGLHPRCAGDYECGYDIIFGNAVGMYGGSSGGRHDDRE